MKCDIFEGQRFCPDCDVSMEDLEYKFVREELWITPEKVELIRYIALMPFSILETQIQSS